MKLPLNMILTPVIKPHFSDSRQFCQHSTFAYSLIYTYFYGTLGFILNLHHLWKHLGEIPIDYNFPNNSNIANINGDAMLIHDLRIIATSMGILQYTCVLIGCFTENPALFLPHLVGQLVIILIKFLNILLALLGALDRKKSTKLCSRIASIMLMLFNWCQEFCVFLKFLCFCDFMEPESNTLLDQLRLKHENHANTLSEGENAEGVRMRLRALLVALLGVSMSACAFASQPVELELGDDDVAQKLSNVSFARRITKPTIRLVMGYGKLSAFITAATSLLLLVAVMSKQSWWRRGTRWLAAPALLVAALEAASDAGDALLAAALRGTSDPWRVAMQTAAAGILVTVEILVWYFIAKFFEHNPPVPQEEREKEPPQLKALPQ